MKLPRFVYLLACAAIVASEARSSGSEGLPICFSLNDQTTPVIASVGSAGFMVAWTDMRSGKQAVYVQRINASGQTAWAINGIRISSDTSDQSAAMIAADGKGGAFVLWRFETAQSYGFAVQHLDSAGTFMLDSKGVKVFEYSNPISMAFNRTSFRVFIADGTGGVLFLYSQYVKSGASTETLYMGRLDASGVRLWSDRNLQTATYTTGYGFPSILPDGSGGGIVGWVPHRYSEPFSTLILRHVNSAGVMTWETSVASETLSVDQMDQFPLAIDMCSDGAGGAFVGIETINTSSGSVDRNIAALRISAAGSKLWGTNGVSVCSAAGVQRKPKVARSALGGFIVAWEDLRSGSSSDLYAAAVNGTGGLPWIANGIPVCMSAGTQTLRGIVADLSGGATIFWDDQRADISDVYAQWVTSSGGSRWTTDGLVVASKQNEQNMSVAAASPAGMAYVVWQDKVNGTDFDIYGRWADPTFVPSTGTIDIGVHDALPEWGRPGPNATVVLTNFYLNPASYSSSRTTNINSVASFDDVPAPGGYDCRVYVRWPDSPFPENASWAATDNNLSPIGAVVNSITRVEITRGQPYASNINVYDAGTNERLVDRVIPAGTPLRIELVINTQTDGPFYGHYPYQEIGGTLILDRDRSPVTVGGVDFDFYKKTIDGPFTTYSGGNPDSIPFSVSPANYGAYYHAVQVRRVLQKQDGYIDIYVTDCSRWGDAPIFTVGIPQSPPSLTSPANGASGVSTNPQLTWNISPGAVSYGVRVALDPSFASLIIDTAGIIGTSFTAKGLAKNTTYYWRVNARNTEGYGPYSAGRSFTTAGASGVGTVEITIHDAKAEWGGPGSSATVSLYNNYLNPITYNASKHAEANSVVTFTDVPAPGGYSYTVNVSWPNSPFTEAAKWGQSDPWAPLAVAENLTVQDQFTRRNPYVNAIHIYNAVTDERIDGNSIPPGTALRVVLVVDTRNQGPFGVSFQMKSYAAAAVFDRDKLPLTVGGMDYDFYKEQTASRTISDQSTGIDSVSVSFTPSEPGAYYYAVQARLVYYVNDGTSRSYATDCSMWSESPIFSVGATPDPPQLLSPADGATGVSKSPQLTWNASAGASSYGVQVSLNTSFTSLVVDHIGIASTSYQVSGLENNTRYYWHVSARNAGIAGGYSIPRSFTTVVAAPTPPSLISPADGAPGVSKNPQLTWSASAGASSYSVQVSLNNSFTSLVVDQTGIVDTTIRVSNLSSVQTYYWHVSASNAGGASTFSLTRTYTTGTTSVWNDEHGIPSAGLLHQNYPNPFNPSTTIRFGLPTRCQVRLTVYNTLGERVVQLVDGEHEAGYHTAVFDASQLVSGVYFYRLQAGTFVETKWLVLLR